MTGGFVMGLIGRKRKKDEKKKRKAAKRVLYAQYAKEGKIKGTKRASRKRIFGSSGNKHQHLIADCGNPGCKRCYPERKSYLSN